MKKNLKIVGILLVVSLFMPFLANAYEFEFKQARGIKVEVLTEEDFSATFNNNLEIPLTDKDIITLAHKLYPPHWEKHNETEEMKTERSEKECREYEAGLLFAALQNPRISDSTRYEVDCIVATSLPNLDKTYSSKHFIFNYTDHDVNTDHNVTLDDVKKTAINLDRYWTKYANNFRTPIPEGKINIKVYYINQTTYGETHSGVPYICLNSKLCVKDDCKRKTVSAHELFHRVQYSYGFVTGTADMKWIVEATAAWSQKYTNITIRDYMARMNSGLDDPDKALIQYRDYDACHFWVYLEKRANWTAIREVWAQYEINGHNAKAAVGTVVNSKKLGKDFDEYVQLWIKANYMKDLANAGLYSYTENEVSKTSCGVKYGPLKTVPKTAAVNVNSNTTWSANGNVSAYGADYYEFNLDKTLKNLVIDVKGESEGAISFHFIGIKGDRQKGITDTTDKSYTYNKKLTPGQWDKVAVVVGGRGTGGGYTISIGACITGTWVSTDKPSVSMDLTQVNGTITGTWRNTSGCGNFTGTGSYNLNTKEISITFNINTAMTNCCSQFTYTGTVNNCNSMSLSWTNVCGGSGNRYFAKSTDLDFSGAYHQDTGPSECTKW